MPTSIFTFGERALSIPFATHVAREASKKEPALLELEQRVRLRRKSGRWFFSSSEPPHRSFGRELFDRFFFPAFPEFDEARQCFNEGLPLGSWSSSDRALESIHPVLVQALRLLSCGQAPTHPRLSVRFLRLVLRHAFPVEPNPPSPRLVSESSSTTCTETRGTAAITIWAMRVPGSRMYVVELVLSRPTFTSPR